ncbi:MAG: respiratory nitrate reductase subunit gamma [Chloroflexi bacterium]|nr:respiratory nitrate reductase subunit gamma [Chloroflexota bacterium]
MHQLFQTLGFVPPELQVPFYALAALAAAIFLLGTFERVWLWSQGKDRPDAALAGVGFAEVLKSSVTKAFSRDCLLASRTFARSRVRGAVLVCIVWGSSALFAGVLVSAVIWVSPIQLISLEVLRVLSSLMDVAGGALLIGLLIALARRYFFRPPRWISTRRDGVVLILFTLAVVTGFLMAGARLAGSGWALVLQWPFGTLFGFSMAVIIDASSFDAWGWHRALYLLHAGAAFALIAYVPYSRLFHIFASPITTFVASQERHQFRQPVANKVCMEEPS